MRLAEKLEKFSTWQLFAGFSVFYVFCLYENSMGILYPVFLAGMLFLYQILMECSGQRIKRNSRFYMAGLLLFGISICLTDNPVILLINKLGIWLLSGVLLLHNADEDRSWSVFRYVTELLGLFGKTIGNLFSVFSEIRESQKKKQKSDGEKKNGKMIYVLLGVLAGVTLLCLILPLLISADAVFGRFTGKMLDQVAVLLGRLILPTRLMGILLMFVWGMMFFSGIYYALKNRKQRAEQNLHTQEPVLAITALAVVGVVYLLFCGIQISYLFLGGFTLPEEYSYAGFARQGFFQLLFVSGLNLGLVVVTLEFFREHKVLKVMLTIISACTYIMIFSSACRMLLYIRAYQLTRLRVLVLAALLILAVLFAGVIGSIYRRDFPLFRYGVAVITVGCLLLSFSRMDAWIASYNLANGESGYLCELSSDASGVMWKAVREETENPENIRAYFSIRQSSLEKQMGIRKFNVSQFLCRIRCEKYFGRRLG